MKILIHSCLILMAAVVSENCLAARCNDLGIQLQCGDGANYASCSRGGEISCCDCGYQAVCHHSVRNLKDLMVNRSEDNQKQSLALNIK